MSSSIGNILKVTIFGESHGPAIGMTIDGLPAGIEIPNEQIQADLANRKTNDFCSTKRTENDVVNFISGVFNNKTTGTPLTFLLPNKDVDSSSYVEGAIRPSHSDLVNYLKTNGNNDFRGGGFSSGRVTASIIVLGAICKEILRKNGIKVGSHIKSIHGVEDRKFADLNEDLAALENTSFPVLDEKAKNTMIEEIKFASVKEDSIGGSVETAIINLPIGLGEPFFDSVESYLSHLIFSIGGVKGIYFGDEKEFINCYGSEVNDQLEIKGEKINYLSNHSSGINGGLTNGQPVIFTTIIKPTPSIGLKQASINLKTKENIELEIKGRHDPCIVHRVRPVIDALTAYAVVDLLMLKESKNIWLDLDC